MKDTILLGSYPLGGARTAVFLTTSTTANLPEGLPFREETLGWFQPCPLVSPNTPAPPSSSFLISDLDTPPEIFLPRVKDLLATHRGRAGVFTESQDLAYLTRLAALGPVVVRIPPLAPHPEKLCLATIAAGVHGVILSLAAAPGEPGISPELWGDFFPRIKSLVFSLERELVRPPVGKFSPRVPGSSASPERGLRVAFQGERGAYSEMAVFSLFEPGKAQAVPLKAFRDVYEAVLKGEVDYGLLPLENALAGPIQDNFDLMLQYPDLHIIAETQIRIQHNLIGLPGTSLGKIKKVLSHPQGLAQSAAFLDKHPEWERVPFYDTAGSVAHIAQIKDGTLAAIASSVAAEVYGMEILVAGVETNPRNFTRFALIAPTAVGPLGKPNKASLVFSTAHSPGALSQCLTILSDHRLNMRKIESRPIHGKPWSYMFYVDVEVPEEEEDFLAARAELESQASEFRLLGSYPSRS